MPSIKIVAEMAQRQCYANPNGDASNRKPEFELATIAALAGTYKIEYFNINSEGEKQVMPSWLTTTIVKAEKTATGQFGFCLPNMPINLPNDIGIYKVKPNSAEAGSYAKSSIGWSEILETMKTGKRYYRIGERIFFPDGLLGNNPETYVVYISAGSIDCDDESIVPQDLVPYIVAEVVKQFMGAKAVIQDKEDDGADNSKRQT